MRKVNKKNIETVAAVELKSLVKNFSLKQLISLYSDLNKTRVVGTQKCQKHVQQVLYRVRPRDRFLGKL